MIFVYFLPKSDMWLKCKTDFKEKKKRWTINKLQLFYLLGLCIILASSLMNGDEDIGLVADIDIEMIETW